MQNIDDIVRISVLPQGPLIKCHRSRLRALASLAALASLEDAALVRLRTRAFPRRACVQERAHGVYLRDVCFIDGAGELLQRIGKSSALERALSERGPQLGATYTVLRGAKSHRA